MPRSVVRWSLAVALLASTAALTACGDDDGAADRGDAPARTTAPAKLPSTTPTTEATATTAVGGPSASGTGGAVETLQAWIATRGASCGGSHEAQPWSELKEMADAGGSSFAGFWRQLRPLLPGIDRSAVFRTHHCWDQKAAGMPESLPPSYAEILTWQVGDGAEVPVLISVLPANTYRAGLADSGVDVFVDEDSTIDQLVNETSASDAGLAWIPSTKDACRDEMRKITAAIPYDGKTPYPASLSELVGGEHGTLDSVPDPARWTYQATGSGGLSGYRLTGVGECAGISHDAPVERLPG